MPDQQPLRLPRASVGREGLPLWLAVLVAAAGGAVLDLAYPAVGAWPLAFLGVALSLVSLIGRRIGGALLVGFVFAAVFFLLHVSWTSRYLGVVPWFALAGVESVLMAVGAVPIALAYRWLPHRRRTALLALPALIGGLWTARELVMGWWPYGGFPWARLGVSQVEGPLANVASWIGISGLTFLMVALVAAIVEWVQVAGWRRARTGIVIAALVTFLVVTPQWRTATVGSITVGAVQGNGPAGYFDEREPLGVLRAQLDATRELLGTEPDVLLWPEGSVDADPRRHEQVARALDQVTTAFGVPLIANAAMTRREKIFNTSFLWEPGAADNPTQTHAKRHPVPFGEYVPDRWFYEAIAPDLIGMLQREYTAGSDEPVFELDEAVIGLAICFDVIYDDVIYEGIRGGAEVFMFQTNNADFRGTDLTQQQLAIARMRAIETGRSVVNLSTAGSSEVISPAGETLERLEAGESGVMLTEVELREGITPAVLVGPILQQLILWGSLAGLAMIGVRRALIQRSLPTVRSRT